MTKKEFLEELSNAIQLDYILKEDQDLNKIEEYDSLALLSISALFSEHFNLEIEGNILRSCQNVSDLIALAKDYIKD
ncbi:acyl carrier protein [Campylobacter sp. RM9939]|uniref:acyl carrier protein n=1 Tax=Campylobacter molothri TaxID=1032242 RepID=UPI001DBE5F45|nr:acyl carrier protein [Campylobacter sp. RM10536]MBZ7952409.1 acyl carrier protein [Campylobacter sp. RM9939]MBZ7956607.1 acyl carrier protein [Campylobacter sp. RM10541]